MKVFYVNGSPSGVGKRRSHAGPLYTIESASAVPVQNSYTDYFPGSNILASQGTACQDRG